MKIRNIVIIWLSRIVLNLISPENKSLFRKLENLEKKKINTQLHREFNQIYIYIHISQPCVNDFSHETNGRIPFV